MKTYEFKIQEHASYWQGGTVSVIANSLEEAKQKVLSGDFEHHGDNEIKFDTERILEREIVEQIKN